jgi:hypothetical protein
MNMNIHDHAMHDQQLLNKEIKKQNEEQTLRELPVMTEASETVVATGEVNMMDMEMTVMPTSIPAAMETSAEPMAMAQVTTADQMSESIKSTIAEKSSDTSTPVGQFDNVHRDSEFALDFEESLNDNGMISGGEFRRLEGKFTAEKPEESFIDFMKANVTDASQMTSEVAEIVGELNIANAEMTEAAAKSENPATEDTDLASQEAIDKAVEDGILDAGLAEELAGTITNQGLTDLGAEPAFTNPDEVPEQFQPGVEDFLASDKTNEFLGRDGSREVSTDEEHANMDHSHSMPMREANEVLTEAPKAPEEIYNTLGDLLDSEGKIELIDRSFIDGNGHSGHTGHTGPEMGHALDIDDTIAAAEAMGMDAMGFLSQYTQDESKFEGAWNDQLKMAGSLTVLNDAVAAKTLGDAINMDNDALSKVAGDATIAAIAGDGATVRSVIDNAGGDTSALSDNMLAQIWGTNSHMYNHATLNYKGPDFGVTHIRSLNDNADDGTERGTLGFYNDKGEWPEWDSHENLRKFMDQYFG